MNYLIKMQNNSLIVAIISLFFLIAFSKAQELDPVVDIDMSKLNQDAQDRLSSFKQEIQSYLSKTKFSNEVIVNDIRGKPYKIKCSFQFIFTVATGFDSYEAQLVMTVQRNIFKTPNYSQLLRIKDENWDFNYLRGQLLYHDDQKFNNLTSFLDYYAYLIIGLDDDSWEPKLGSDRFLKAQNLVNLALSSSSAKGWSENNLLKASRNIYTSELLNSKYDDFRKAFWIYHFAGIDSVQYGKRTALERISQAIEMIGKYPGVLR